MNGLLKKLIIWLVPGLLIIVSILLVIGGIREEKSKINVILESKNLTSAKLYSSKSDGHEYVKNKLIASISAGEKKQMKVAWGFYIVEFYESNETRNTLSEYPISIDTTILTPDLIFTKSKLEEIANNEKEAIIKSPNLQELSKVYSFGEIVMYGKGDIAGIELISKNVDIDHKKAIIEKKDSSWVLIAGPEIIIEKRDFPNIPLELLRQINNTR